MKVGDQVKWAKPLNQDENKERFTLIEVNDDRCFIRFICDLPIPPVQVAKTADLVIARDELSSNTLGATQLVREVIAPSRAPANS